MGLRSCGETFKCLSAVANLPVAIQGYCSAVCYRPVLPKFPLLPVEVALVLNMGIVFFTTG